MYIVQYAYTVSSTDRGKNKILKNKKNNSKKIKERDDDARAYVRVFVRVENHQVDFFFIQKTSIYMYIYIYLHICIIICTRFDIILCTIDIRRRFAYYYNYYFVIYLFFCIFCLMWAERIVRRFSYSVVSKTTSTTRRYYWYIIHIIIALFKKKNNNNRDVWLREINIYGHDKV